MNTFSHMNQLEAESIFIFREVVANCKKPVLMYSIGKDSSVLLHLARKAFFPGKIPFPVLHVDTQWKFKEMIAFRDKIAQESNLDLIVYTNPDGIKENVTPFNHSSSNYTYIMKTLALKQALDKYGFDVAIGGARRDEEKSRAKEKIFSIRSKNHIWDPKNQRQEFWGNYNTYLNSDQTIRAFPISNWTELDIWLYIKTENIPIVPLYFSKARPVIRQKDSYIMVDDERLPVNKDEIEHKEIRFRTLGCYPLTSAIESKANTLEEIISEVKESKYSERHGRLIDQDEDQGLEQKKKEGYF